MWNLVDGENTPVKTMHYWSHVEAMGVCDGHLHVNPQITNVIIITSDTANDCTLLHQKRFWKARYEGETGRVAVAEPYRLSKAVEYLLDDGVSIDDIDYHVIPNLDLRMCLEKGLEYEFDLQEL